MLLLHCGLVLQQVVQPEDGFTFRSIRCSGRTNPKSRCTQCDSCCALNNNAEQYARMVHSLQLPTISFNGTSVSKVHYWQFYKCRAGNQKVAPRRAKAREVFCRNLAKNGSVAVLRGAAGGGVGRKEVPWTGFARLRTAPSCALALLPLCCAGRAAHGGADVDGADFLLGAGHGKSAQGGGEAEGAVDVDGLRQRGVQGAEKMWQA